MCFQHNQTEIQKKFPSFIEEQVYVVQLNVVVIEPLIQSDFSFRNLILKINDIILCMTFSILFSFILTEFYLILYSFVKKVDQESLTTFGKDLKKKGKNR